MDRLHADLCRFDAAEWARAVSTLSSEIHDIDRPPPGIWFAFYPLNLHLALEPLPTRPRRTRKLGLMGKWGLADRSTARTGSCTRIASGRR